MVTVERIAVSIAEKGFTGLLSRLAAGYFSRSTKSISASEGELKTDLSEHLFNTFNKCMEIKTILSDKKPEKMLSLYVDQHFEVDGAEIDQYSLVEKIKSGCAAVITGTGGGGKSMFMRYLWLSFFENSGGKIPFFLEMRQINSLTHSSITDFIYHSIIKSGSTIGQDSFNKALKAGEFVLFFDGFDEVNYDQRHRVEEMIISLREHYPNATIIVTSRPDERFMGWHQFSTYKVKPLHKKQVTELIKRAPYPQEHKDKFLKQLDKLFASHESFLRTPLLAYMMLVTFAYNPDIPRNMFLFYEQAFDALYTRHDLTKGGYKRKFYTDLERQELVRLLSFFCLKSYYDEDFEFTEAEINETIDKAKSIEGISVNNQLFIMDMLESICLLKKEGIVYNFTHRSFQEYFAANCIARVAIRNIDRLFSKFARRYNDSVMLMVYDINVDLFREKYIVDNYRKFTDTFNIADDNEFIRAYFLAADARIDIDIRKNAASLSAMSGAKRRRHPIPDFNFGQSGELHDFFVNCRRIFSSRQTESLNYGKFHDDDWRFIRKLVKLVPPTRFEIIYARVQGSDFVFDGLPPELNQKVVVAFNQMGYIQYMRANILAFRDFVKTEVRKHEEITQSFDDHF